MPTFDATTETKITELRALRAAHQRYDTFELVKIDWPSPTGAVYYSVLQTDEEAVQKPSVSPIEVRLIPNSSPDWFVPVSMDASIGDEEVELDFWDGDGIFSDLLLLHGEGIKIELFYFIPQVDLLLPVWFGHLRVEDAADIAVVKVKAAQGFRSADGNMPRRAHWQECQAIFGAVFDTQAEIDENDCPYNLHIGGSTGNNDPATSLPYTSCPRRTRQDCIDRLGNNGNFMLSHATVSQVVTNNQTHGPRLFSTSFGNETNLKEPVPVVMGYRRKYDMKVVNFRRDLNNNTPDHGWFAAEYECCEGPIDQITSARVTVGSETQDVVPLHYAYRLGTQGQTPVGPDLTVHSYSSTALIRYNFGWVDPSQVDPDQASASAQIRGLNNIRVYSDADTYTETFTTNRAWQIARMLCDKRWGLGYDYERLNIDSFIDAAEWCDEQVRYTDSFGNTWDHVRARSDVELIERKVQQQIEDMCLAGRLSRPFIFDGKIHITPLRGIGTPAVPIILAAEAISTSEVTLTWTPPVAAVEGDTDIPEFTDEGPNRNIIRDGDPGEEKSTLVRSRISDIDLPNRVECTYDDAVNDYLETPLSPVEDVDAQLRAGHVVGDNSRKVNIKKYSLLGVTVKEQAIKLAWSLLDLGQFDEGGLQNNLHLKFKIWYIDALTLHQEKIIKLTSSRIAKYGFQYFRIKKIHREADLHVTIEAQAFNETYMATFETVLSSLPGDPSPVTPVATSPTPRPEALEIGDITYTDRVLTIAIPSPGSGI